MSEETRETAGGDAPSSKSRENSPPTSSLSPRRQILFRLVALFIGLAVSFVFAELGLRGYLAYTFRGKLEELSREVPKDPNKQLSLGDLVYPVANDRIVFRLKPNARGHFKWAPVRINSLGYHDDEFQVAKKTNEFRILVLGDSNSFGWGVLMEMAYPMVLEQSLQVAAGDEVHVEVINTAVPGYNAAMEVETFFEYGLQYDPDLVLIQYSLNDNILPVFLLDQGYTTRWDRLYLTDPEALSYLIAGFDNNVVLEEDTTPLSAPMVGPAEQDLDEIPEKYHKIVGPEATFDAYRQLQEACADRGIPLYCTYPAEFLWLEEPAWPSDPRYDQIRGFCEELGIEILDPFQFTRDFAFENDLTSEDLAINPPEDWHPTEVRHSLMAQFLFPTIAKHLEKHGVTDSKIELVGGYLQDLTAFRLKQYREEILEKRVQRLERLRQQARARDERPALGATQ